jgi:DNA polymerase III gamma/tau subunit
MVSGDLSVFWQEIIDSYRDVMVVKNSERAKAYLDLTDIEFSRLSAIASKVSMACLSYHISMLENAMSDMQRALNSKRSIAEITLTRMCDTRSVNTPEALLLRIEELERAVAMLKLGVPVAQTSAPENKPVVETVEVEASAPVAEPSGESVSYSKWGRVIERIGEIKKSLSAGIASASVFKNPDGSFTIRANSFFAAKLASNEADFAIVRGVLADVEGVSRDDVKIHIQAAEKRAGGAFLELDNALK